MSVLIAKYGEYIIEPGTLLFRKAANREFYNTMFFGFCTAATGASSIRSQTIQVWKVKTEMSCLLMLRGQKITDYEPFLFSALVEIYNEHFPLDKKHEYDDVNLKKSPTIVRQRIINLLISEGIYSWVCSVEDYYVMEVFLFGGIEKNRNLVSYVDSYKDTVENINKYSINSFNYEKIRHLPNIKKGPAPNDPFIDLMMSNQKK